MSPVRPVKIREVRVGGALVARIPASSDEAAATAYFASEASSDRYPEKATVGRLTFRNHKRALEVPS